MKHVWQSSCRAITGASSGTASNTLVGHTLTQMSQRMQRLSLTSSIMLPFLRSARARMQRGLFSTFARAPGLARVEPRGLRPHADAFEPARDEPALLSRVECGKILVFVHAARLLTQPRRRVHEASRRHHRGGFAPADHATRTLFGTRLHGVPQRVELIQGTGESRFAAEEVAIVREDLRL